MFILPSVVRCSPLRLWDYVCDKPLSVYGIAATCTCKPGLTFNELDTHYKFACQSSGKWIPPLKDCIGKCMMRVYH